MVVRANVYLFHPRGPNMSKIAKQKLAMITRQLVVLSAAVALTAFATTVVVSSADHHKDKHDHGDHAHADHKHGDAPGMPSPEEMAKMMEMVVKMGTPGAEHELLKGMSGTWKATCKAYHAPGMEPDVSKGTTRNEMMLGDRFAHQHFKGMMKMPTADGGHEESDFEGVGVMGYDKIKKHYFTLWMDNFGTTYYTATGQYDAAKKELTMIAVGPDPMKGMQDSESKWVWRFESKNRYAFEMHMDMGGGNWFKHMEIIYEK